MEADDSELLISSVVPWELATKFHIGKWPGADAILAAQAEIEAAPIVTADPAIPAMGVEVMW